MLKKLFFIGIPIIAILIGALLFSFELKNSDKHTKFKPSNEAVLHSNVLPEADVESDNSTVSGDAVKKAHEILNEFVGWGGSEKFNFDSTKNRFDTLNKYIQLALDHTSSKTIQSDLQNSLSVLEKAQETKDIDGIIIAHRILHDLDGFINEDPLDGKVWGYTETVTGSAEEVLKYITK